MEALAIIISMIVMFLWLRTEANADRRQNQANNDLIRQETNQLISAIHQEIKDFHGRLCALESKRK